MEDKSKSLLIQYAGLATQLAVGLLLTAYAGIWIDKRIAIGFPLLVWLLPLLLLIVMMIKAARDTSKK